MTRARAKLGSYLSKRRKVRPPPKARELVRRLFSNKQRRGVDGDLDVCMQVLECAHVRTTVEKSVAVNTKRVDVLNA